MSATIPQSKEELIDAARSAGDNAVRLRAEQENVWEELIVSLEASIPERRSCRSSVLLLERYEHKSREVIRAMTTFRAAIRKVGLAGYSAEYLAIGDDVRDRLGFRSPVEVLGAEQAPGFAFAGGPAA